MYGKELDSVSVMSDVRTGLTLVGEIYDAVTMLDFDVLLSE